MEMTLNKHHVTIETMDNTMHITVIRMRDLGGVPRVLRLQLDTSIEFGNAMKKLSNLTKLDDEMYAMMAEHTK